jgi:hypothetical protein
MSTIETLHKLKESGFPEQQAEAIIEAFDTRDRAWFETQFEKLRGRITAAEGRMSLWIVGAVLINHFWK